MKNIIEETVKLRVGILAREERRDFFILLSILILIKEEIYPSFLIFSAPNFGEEPNL